MDPRTPIAEALRPLRAQCSYIDGDEYDQGRQDTLIAVEATLGEWAATMAAVVEQQRQEIEKLRGDLERAREGADTDA
ncbi:MULTISPECIES: hypothetical protein [unclassified Nocardiopsis]|uniref:hypothetical protein n=1 Tax=Nocardiopsis TaxID=2013 RepID=UPI00387B60CF